MFSSCFKLVPKICVYHLGVCGCVCVGGVSGVCIYVVCMVCVCVVLVAGSNIVLASDSLCSQIHFEL